MNIKGKNQREEEEEQAASSQQPLAAAATTTTTPVGAAAPPAASASSHHPPSLPPSPPSTTTTTEDQAAAVLPPLLNIPSRHNNSIDTEETKIERPTMRPPLPLPPSQPTATTTTNTTYATSSTNHLRPQRPPVVQPWFQRLVDWSRLPPGAIAEEYEKQLHEQQQQQQQQQQQNAHLKDSSDKDEGGKGKGGAALGTRTPTTFTAPPTADLSPQNFKRSASFTILRQASSSLRAVAQSAAPSKEGLIHCAVNMKTMFMIFGSLLVAMAVIYYATETDAVKPINISFISLPFGEVRGKITKTYAEYLGVPYAMPPGRFEAPLMYDGRFPEGYWDATVVPPVCAQVVNGRVFGEEDCLFLNVYAPTQGVEEETEEEEKLRGVGGGAGAAPAGAGAGAVVEPAHLRGRRRTRRKLPTAATTGEAAEEVEETERKPPRAVMVYFHGGGFSAGSSTEVVGRKLAATNNVIVVTVAYRLGPLGFLAHPEMLQQQQEPQDPLTHAQPAAPQKAAISAEVEENNTPTSTHTPPATGAGNFGLLDQQLALQWIVKHIKAFNGDPERITVFGHGAGGTSACLQAILPSNTHLKLRTAIVESGACHAAPLEEGLRQGEVFMQAAGCTTVGCLKKRPLERLLLSNSRVGTNTYTHSSTEENDKEKDTLSFSSSSRYRHWQPVVDGILLPAPASELLQQAATKGPLSMIAGANSDEGVAFIGASEGIPSIETDEEYVAFVRAKEGGLREVVGMGGLTEEEVEELLLLYPPDAQAVTAGEEARVGEIVGGVVEEGGGGGGGWRKEGGDKAIKATKEGEEEQGGGQGQAPAPADGAAAAPPPAPAAAAAAPLVATTTGSGIKGNKANLVNMISDAHYLCPTLFIGKTLGPKAYLYHFRYSGDTHPPTNTPTDTHTHTNTTTIPCSQKHKKSSWRWTSSNPTRPHLSYGPTAAVNDSHGAEIPYIFHDATLETHTHAHPCGHGGFSEVEDRLAHEMERYWTTFATTGVSPNALLPTQVALPPPPVVVVPEGGDGGEGLVVEWLEKGVGGGGKREKEGVVVRAKEAENEGKGGKDFSLRKTKKEEEEEGKVEEEEEVEEELEEEEIGDVHVVVWPAFVGKEGEAAVAIAEGRAGEELKVLVYKTTSEAVVEAPDRLKFCAFWERTKVSM